jgi:16S rRNA (guanine527-N7)-methyltransferase
MSRTFSFIWKNTRGKVIVAEAAQAAFAQDVSRLLDLTAQTGVVQRSDAHEVLCGLSDLIQDRNRAINLVSRKDISRLVSYHFCDAASLLALVKPGVDIEVLDVGGSNGIPGLVLAAVSPHIRTKVCDSRQKRRGFLGEACSVVGRGSTYEIERVESEGFRRRYADVFDLVVARAVTRLKLLWKWCLPLIRPGGFLVAYKGSRCLEEVRYADDYVWSRGAGLVMVADSPWADKCNPLRRFAILGKVR